MQFGVLGPIEITTAEGTVHPEGLPARILAALVARARSVVSVETLIDEVWPEDPPASARQTLQSKVSRLRAVVGQHTIVSSGPGYRLDVGRGDVDADRFEDLAHELDAMLAATVGAALDQRAGELLEAIDALWRGPAFAGHDRIGLVGPVAVALEGRRIELVGRWSDVALAAGDARTVARRLEPLCHDHPLHEHLWANLAMARYRAGRQADALRVCGQIRRALLEELGISPGPELAGVEQRILEQDPTLLLVDTGGAGPAPAGAVSAPSSPPPAGGRRNLPRFVTEFVGRAEELDELVTIVASRQLVTFAGIGGVGKTRLAAEVARRLGPARRDGAWFVDLTAVPVAASADIVLAAVAATVGDDRAGSDRLLVLDGCDHVLDGVAEAAARLLAAGPGLTIVATSRFPLRTPGEHRRVVGPLGAPDAVALLHARVIEAGVLPDPAENGARLEELARSVDGVPLAIELVAPRVAALGAERVARDLRIMVSLQSNEARMNTGERALRASLAWAFDLLPEPSRLLLRRLAVLVGPFDVDAALAVGGFGLASAADSLEDLITNNLLGPAAVGVSGRRRFRMPDPVREHASDVGSASGPDDEARQRHLTWFTSVAAALDDVDWDGGAARTVEAVEAQYGDLLAALDWSVPAGRSDDGLRLAHGLALYWLERNRCREGLDRMATLLASASDPTPDRAGAARRAALLARELGDHDAEVALLDDAVSTARTVGDQRELGRALGTQGELLASMGRLDGASTRLDEARAVARRCDDHRYVMQADLLLAQVKLLQADLDEALRLVRAVLAQAGRLAGSHRSMARSLFGEILWAQGDHAGADAALAASVDPSDAWSTAFGATARLNLALDRDDLAAAATHASGGGDRRLPLLRSAAGLLQVRLDVVDEGVAAIQDAVEECRWRTDPVGVVSCLLQLGEAHLRSGAPVAADVAYAEAVAAARDCGLGLALVRGLDGLAVGRQQSGVDASELLEESDRLRAANGNPRPPALRRLLEGRR